MSRRIPSTPIRSIQRGTVTVDTGLTSTGTATITAVDTAKSELRILGWTAATTTAFSSTTVASPATVFPRIALTNSTTVTITTGGTIGSGGNTIMSFEVTEYF